MSQSLMHFVQCPFAVLQPEIVCTSHIHAAIWKFKDDGSGQWDSL